VSSASRKAGSIAGVAPWTVCGTPDRLGNLDERVLEWKKVFLMRLLFKAAVFASTLSLALGFSQVKAMTFKVDFDTTIAEVPGPTPPFIGTGFFSFSDSTGQPSMPDGSYKFASLTNVILDFSFDKITQITSNPLEFFYYYFDPQFQNISFLYDSSKLDVVIYDNGQRFYFDGPGSVATGNPSASLYLLMKPSYVSTYYPDLNSTEPVFLSFEPNDINVPPPAIQPTAPFNRYGIYAKLLSDAAGCTPPPGNLDPDYCKYVLVNGTYGLPVPGPLPILGATASFAWSRRLRQRLRSSTAK
jgi:hypothetical protein